jgi:hypothetical protein
MDGRRGTDFAIACPVAGCDERLGATGLLPRHVLEHLHHDGFPALLRALVRVWHEHLRLLRLEAASFEAARSCLASDVLNFLSRRESAALGEIAAAVGEREPNVRTVLARLECCGVVVRVSKGKYRLLTDAHSSTGIGRRA